MNKSKKIKQLEERVKRLEVLLPERVIKAREYVAIWPALHYTTNPTTPVPNKPVSETESSFRTGGNFK